MTENIIEASTPKPRGGPRPGSGRKPGSKNRRTIRKEKQIQAAVEEAMAATGSAEQIEKADPREALEFCLRAYWKAGDLEKLAGVAGTLMNFTYARVATAEKVDALPTDLEPDPKPEPDEDAPAELIE